LGERKHIHEDRLRHLWDKQFLKTDALVTTDGRSLKVINPGVLNRGSGPDFRDATIILDGRTYRGDIEFHTTGDDWKAHEHQSDSKYNSLVLHVVLHSSPTTFQTKVESGRTVPVLILDQFLSSPLDEIIEHISRAELVSQAIPIPCAGKNNAVSSSTINDWIHVLFLQRMRKKMDEMKVRLVEIIQEHQRTVAEPPIKYGEIPEEGNPDEVPLPSEVSGTIGNDMLRKRIFWEQLLYESMMEALGYSNNKIPFRSLAQRVTIQTLEKLHFRSPLSLVDLQSILFDSAGLIPSYDTIDNQPVKIYVHQLHAGLRNFAGLQRDKMYASEWIFSPTRPSNFPTIRLAAGSSLIAKIISEQLLQQIITLLNVEYTSPQTRYAQLVSLLACPEDPFWSYHYSFRETMPKPHAILGENRKNDIIINTVIPFACLYADIFKKKIVSTNAISVAYVIDRLEENVVLRRMRRQLIGDKANINFAFQQQGIIHLYRHFCTRDRCSECEIGKIVFAEHPT
jgi:Protein of unknown function (DUF2851)